jgi:hypothetical protein
MKRLCCVALQLLPLKDVINRILFLKAVTSSGVPQGGDGDHMKIYIW